MILWEDNSLFYQTLLSGNNLFFSVFFFFYCILSINGIGLLISKKINYDKEIYPFLGICFIISFCGLAAINSFFLIIINFFFLPLGFLYYLLSIIKKKINLNDRSLFYYLILISYFFVSFFHFHLNYDDHAGYFPLIESFKNGNTFKNSFNFRALETYPGYFYFNSLFLKNASYFQSKFIDNFYGYYLTIFLVLEYIKNLKFNKKENYLIIFFVAIFVFSLNTTISPHVFSTPFVLLSVILFYEIIKEKTKFDRIFLLFITLSILPLISFKNIPIAFFIAFFIGFFFIGYSVLFKKFEFKKIIIPCAFSFLIILPWLIYSQIHFDTIFYILFGSGTSVASYPQFSEYTELIKQFKSYDVFLSSINNYGEYGYRYYNNPFLYKFTYHHLLFYSLLVFFIFYLTKEKFLLIKFTILILAFLSFNGSGASVWSYFKYIYPFIIAFSIFSVLIFIKHPNLKKFKYILPIIFICFLTFEKISLGSHAKNFIQEIFKINTRGGEHNKFNVLYPLNEMVALKQITKNIKNKNILTYIERPYLLNMKNNNIYPIDFHSFYTSPKPGYPLKGSYKKHLDFFKNSKIDYILTTEYNTRPNWRNGFYKNEFKPNISEFRSNLMMYMNTDFSKFINNLIKKNPDLVEYNWKNELSPDLKKLRFLLIKIN